MKKLLISALLLSCGELVDAVYQVEPIEIGELSDFQAFQAIVGATSNFKGEWILIEKGTFTRSNGRNEMYNQTSPYTYIPKEIEVDSFYMSKTEITVAQYRECVNAGVCTAPNDQKYDADCNWGYKERDHYPVNCVDWKQARSYAKWVAGELPSEIQWEYAASARGQNIKYPWGEETPSCELAQYLNCERGTIPVCDKPAGNTAQGLCDMGGNVWEWMLDEYHYIGSDTELAVCSDQDCSIKNNRFRMIRGGSWTYEPFGLMITHRNMSAPRFRFNNIGFRVLTKAKSI